MKGPATLALVVGGVLAVAAVSLLLLEDGPDGLDTAAAPVLNAGPSAPERQPDVRGAAGEVSRLDADAPAPDALAGALDGQPVAGSAAALAAEAGGERVTLVGRVVDTAGRPVAGARLVFHDEAAAFLLDRDGELGGERPETASGDDGRFRLEMALPRPPENDGMMRLGGSAAGQVVAFHRAFAAQSKECPTLEADAEVALGTFELALGASLSGRVVDEAGRPVAGAHVTARNPVETNRRGGFALLMGGLQLESYTSAESGRDGRFEIHGLAAGQASVTAQADGFQVGFRGDLELVAGVTTPVGALVLPEGAQLAGVVLDEAGNPVEGASVRASSFARLVISSEEDVPRRQLGNEMRRAARTDADGAWRLTGLGPGQYTVHVSADGFDALDQPNITTGVTDLVSRLSRLGGLLVRLVSGDGGAPVDGAELTARPARRFPFGPRGGGELEVLRGEAALAAAGESGDAAGLYLVQGAGTLGTELVVRADGFAVAEIDGPAVGSGAVGRLDVVLQPEAVLAGLVLDTAGRPVPGARVTLSEHVPPPTTRDGNFEVRREVVIGGDSQGPTWNKVLADAQGAFEIRGVPAGDWELVAAADDHASPEPLVLTLAEGQSQRDVEVPLVPAGSIAGLVLEQDGLPSAGAEVSVRPLPEPGRGAAAGDPAAALASLLGQDDARKVTADGDGRFTVGDLLPGLYEVSLVRQQGLAMGGAMVFIGSGMEQASGPKEVVEVVAASTVEIQLVRPPTARLSGRVVAGGQAVPDTTVTLSEANAFLPFGGQKATTDSSGRYEFSGIEPGDYKVSAQVAGAALPEEAEVELRAGLEERQDLVFAGITLRGRVVDADTGDGVPGVTVNVSKTSGSGRPQQRMAMVTMIADGGGGGSGMSMELGGGDLSKVRSGPDGQFEVRWLKPGEYGIQTTGGGYARAEAGPFQVSEAEVEDDVVIEAVRGAVLSGRVISGETGELLDGVPVSLSGGGSREMSMAEGGSYRFEGLAEGEYQVTVMGSGFGGQPIALETVALGRGEDRVLDLTTSNELAATGAAGGGFFFGSPGEDVELEFEVGPPGGG